MLSKLQILWMHHLKAALTSLDSLRRKPMATLATILVIAITLALPALFWVFTNNIQRLTANWQQGGHISLYLKSSLSVAETTAILLRVQETEGVGQATLKSSAEGLLELQQQEGMEDVMQYLPENPIPAVIDVLPSIAVDTPEKLNQLYLKLKSFPSVEQGKLDLQWINRLHAVLGFVHAVAQGLMVLLGLAVLLIIGNTLRLAIHNHHDEIQILKLIGATDSYIVRPFLYMGLCYGLVGAFLAILLVNTFIFSLASGMKHLTVAYQLQLSLVGLSISQVLTLILAAAGLGWLGARLSVLS